ncbi:MAG: efflux RND transporter periplasmic adaptor subunit [Oscillospiraceae bacterium]|nr:efflux RND transporter periplasmic adaptor subunit [Oscillospiraceae bacterium]
MKKYVPLILAVTAVWIFSGCLPEEEEPLDAPVVRAAEVERPTTAATARGDLVSTVKITCNYRPLSEKTYYFPVNGYFVEAVYVNIGDDVTAGQLLAELDRSDLLEAITEAKYDVRQQEVNYGRSGYSSAGAKQVEIAKLKLAELQNREAERLIYAENDGKVTFVRSYDADTRSSSMENVVTVSDRSVAAYSVGFAGAENIKEGATYQFNIGGVEYPVEAIADENSYLFYPDVPIADAASYGYITVEIARSDNALYVPGKAVKQSNDGFVVYTLNEAGLRQSVPVKVGLRVNGRAEILSGLEEGDEVIVE